MKTMKINELTDFYLYPEEYTIGELAAEVMLRGIKHRDLTRQNIVFSQSAIPIIVDYADASFFTMPEGVDEALFQRLYDSRGNSSDSFSNDLITQSRFRAGFVARGGIWGQLLYMHCQKDGFSCFNYIPEQAPISSFDKDVYSQFRTCEIQNMITEWKNLQVDHIRFIDYNFARYEKTSIRKYVSKQNLYFVDKLYFSRCLAVLCDAPTKKNKNLLLFKLGELAMNYSYNIIAYGLIKKYLLESSKDAPLISLCRNYFKQITNIVAFPTQLVIDKFLHYDDFALVWILEELEFHPKITI